MASESVSSWCDITVDDASGLAEYYQKVMNWTIEEVDMGDYCDYVMMDKNGQPTGGICHARGNNKSMPGGWIPYFTVEDLSASLTHAVANGGEQISEVRHAQQAEYCLIRDPSGAFCALYSNLKR